MPAPMPDVPPTNMATGRYGKLLPMLKLEARMLDSEGIVVRGEDSYAKVSGQVGELFERCRMCRDTTCVCGWSDELVIVNEEESIAGERPSASVSAPPTT